jgi:hypothetical protein
MDVLLTFINQSEVSTGSRVVLFQKNHLEGHLAAVHSVAWRVLHISGQDDRQRLHVSTLLSVAAKNAMGSVCEQHLTAYNQRWDVINTKTRDWMIPSGHASDPNRIEIRNNLPREPITAQLYKDGRLLAEQSGVEPKTTVAFHFDNTLWLGITADDIREGDAISAGQLKFETELPLEGFSKADLILTNTGDEYKFRLVPVAAEAVMVR